MPSKSQKQRQFFERCLKDEKFRNEHKVSYQVAQEFVDADKNINFNHLPEKVKTKKKSKYE